MKRNKYFAFGGDPGATFRREMDRMRDQMLDAGREMRRAGAEFHLSMSGLDLGLGSMNFPSFDGWTVGDAQGRARSGRPAARGDEFFAVGRRSRRCPARARRRRPRQGGHGR